MHGSCHWGHIRQRCKSLADGRAQQLEKRKQGAAFFSNAGYSSRALIFALPVCSGATGRIVLQEPC
jgi:hypothetical protein